MATATSNDWIRALRDGRWTAAEGRRVLAAWAESGLCVSEFARRHGVTAHRLHWWRKRLGDGGWDSQVEEAEPMVRFVPAVLRTGVATEGDACVVVRVPQGPTVEVADPERVSPTWLACLVRSLWSARS
jgi:transposase-like protein